MTEIIKCYYDNGSLYWEGEYMNDVLNGYFKTYHDNGNLCAISYFLDDVQEGEDLLIIRNAISLIDEINKQTNYEQSRIKT